MITAHCRISSYKFKTNLQYFILYKLLQIIRNGYQYYQIELILFYIIYYMLNSKYLSLIMQL